MWKYNQTPDNNILLHTGVKGMKWGKRKKRVDYGVRSKPVARDWGRRKSLINKDFKSHKTKKIENELSKLGVKPNYHFGSTQDLKETSNRKVSTLQTQLTRSFFQDAQKHVDTLVKDGMSLNDARLVSHYPEIAQKYIAEYEAEHGKS